MAEKFTVERLVETVGEMVVMSVEDRIHFTKAAKDQIEENEAGGLPDKEEKQLLRAARFDQQALQSAKQKLAAHNS